MARCNGETTRQRYPRSTRALRHGQLVWYSPWRDGRGCETDWRSTSQRRSGPRSTRWRLAMASTCAGVGRRRAEQLGGRVQGERVAGGCRRVWRHRGRWSARAAALGGPGSEADGVPRRTVSVVVEVQGGSRGYAQAGRQASDSHDGSVCSNVAPSWIGMRAGELCRASAMDHPRPAHRGPRCPHHPPAAATISRARRQPSRAGDHGTPHGVQHGVQHASSTGCRRVWRRRGGCRQAEADDDGRVPLGATGCRWVPLGATARPAAPPPPVMRHRRNEPPESQPYRRARLETSSLEPAVPCAGGRRAAWQPGNARAASHGSVAICLP
jgi:hypothetical protein